MDIRRCNADDAAPWARLRGMLWPTDGAGHDAEVQALLERPGFAAWLCRAPGGKPIGFAEAALRHDYVNGCDTSPVAFLQGIYVLPEHRERGVARALVDAAAAWGRTQGCSEFASDAEIDNVESQRMHHALGFEETERVIYFRRAL